MMVPDNHMNVLSMILWENRDQRLTEALILGIERAVSHYLAQVEASEQKAIKESGNGT